MNKRIYTKLLILFAFFSFTINAQNNPFNPEKTNDGWAIESELKDNPKIEKMDSLISNNEFKSISSVVIAHKGKIVFENYYNDNNSDTKHNMRSATKSIKGTLIGSLIQDGSLKSVDEKASQLTGGGLGLRSCDLLKIGQLYLNSGKWNDNQIISEEFIQKSTKPHAEVGMFDYEYGYLWRLSEFGQDQKEKAYFKSGTGGNKIVVIPELELVVVLTSTYYNGATKSYTKPL